MLFALAAISLTSPVAAACMSLAEARKEHPTSYLRYHTEGRRQGGRPCWFPVANGAPAARPLWPVRLPISRPVEVTPQQRIAAALRGGK